MPQDTLISAYQNHFNTSNSVTCKPIKKGASGRTIIRMEADGKPSVIAVHYTFERKDNALHKPVSDLLEECGVTVPRILFSDLEKQVLLIEDIGGTDLLSLKDEAWSVREPYYRSVFEELARIAKITPPAESDLMPAFTEETYRWEQDYFASHFLGTHLGLSAEEFLSDSRITTLARELGAEQPDLVHRDFQSQNLMLRDGAVYVIDFQGARPGYVEYDLASFIYDPYMRHPLEERQKLRALWQEVSGRSLDDDLMRKCAMQRLMQALGAYGNMMLLSLVKGTEYEELFTPLEPHKA